MDYGETQDYTAAKSTMELFLFSKFKSNKIR